MFSRRNFNSALAGAALPLVTGLPARADTPSQDRSSRDTPNQDTPNQVEFIAYAMPTKYHPIAALGTWPLDHTCVSAGDLQWGCFGRAYKDDPTQASPIARGMGDPLWAQAIAGPDGHALIDYGVTGVCDQCSNRILLPAGIDCRNSPGNEVATLLSGTYGLGIKELVVRIKDAAAAVNRDHKGRVSEAAVADAVRRVDRGLDGEWEIVRYDIDRIIKPAVGARYATLKLEIEDAYLSLYYKRQALAGAYGRGAIDKKTLVGRVTTAYVALLEDLKEIMGVDDFKKIVPVSPEVAADYVFHQKD